MIIINNRKSYFFFYLFRHPIPEYYSITVEIARDRITTAEEILCDSQNPDIMKCPSKYNDGDIFLHRTINEACQQMVCIFNFSFD